ncbi:DUF2236 domain-containing protein [Nocardioides humilatus]|uniref:DUF2236 domain-containing protein n=1 Tax=Nocardioides humilatus TaxID=2607660 RepID=A0A5B1LNX8_9ACTN|nr:oxygenase MpaB family protein [Nocardioides humilatus]KAA1421339.1 DUF2236 domain-containing protein [Nocardioides humilatus]
MERTSVAVDWAEDWRFLMLVGTGLLMQVSHPVIGGGVEAYSTYATDPYGRFDRSVWPVLAMVVMGEEAAGFSADLRAMHKQIGGTDHQGRSFHAWDPEGAFLVPATACYATEKAAEIFGKRLTADEAEDVYAAWRAAGLAFGIPESRVPKDYLAYREWLDAVVEERLEDHPTAHEVLGTIRRPPAPPRVPAILWRPIGHGVVGRVALLVTVGTIPPTLRTTLGLRWTARDERALRAFGTVVRLIDRALPRVLRKPTGRIIRHRWDSFRTYAAHGAALGIAPNLAKETREHVA